MSVQNNEFDRLSTEFLGWFNDTPDTRVHPDISIADFRRHGRGRGVSKLSLIDELVDLDR